MSKLSPVFPAILTAAVAAAIVMAPAVPAWAACGDDVGGARVACRCGDTVVSSTRLQPDDPVVRERCSSDGLRVRASHSGGTLVLDLAGLTIRGRGRGVGIRVVSGSDEGVVIVGGSDGQRASVVGFRQGLGARGQRTLWQVRNVSFEGNTRDGVALRGAGTELSGVVSRRNGRDGIRVGGRSPKLSGVEATDNGRYGLRLTGKSASIGAATTGNGGGSTRVLGHGQSKAIEGDGR
jgi:hypothetical protein